MMAQRGRDARPKRDGRGAGFAPQLTVSNLPLPLDALLPQNEGELLCALDRALGLPAGTVRGAAIAKRSVDARKKSNVRFVVSANVELASPQAASRLAAKPPKGVSVQPFKPYHPLELPDLSRCAARASAERPVVVGAGPAGLFCAWYLARCGLAPLLIEQGAPVEERQAHVAAFRATGVLDPASNIQFGEGGAGTFSDGKLTTNTKNPLTPHVLHWLIEAGAPVDILQQAHPHVGSDLLIDVVARIRKQIIALGGEVRFHTRLVGIDVSDGAVAGVELESVRSGQASASGDAQETGEALAEDDAQAAAAAGQPAVMRVPCNQLVIACGHSARHTFQLMRDAGFPLERKPFSVGVRIEHPQEMVNKAQWGMSARHPALGAAEYKLAVHLPGGRSVYTFCMCPGGQVVAAASEEGGVVTNGMSNHARDLPNANAAVLVGVNPDDFPGTDVLAGVEFQRQIEQAAFRLAAEHGGAPYQAPAQTVGAFLADLQPEAWDSGAPAASSTSGAEPKPLPGASCTPTYGRGVVEAPIAQCLPGFVVESLAQALPLLDAKLRGFADPGAVLTAPETRSSSPVRVRRDQALQAEGIRGAYPCGEGPGYAGGIMSAAVDGMRVARQVVDDWQEVEGVRA